MKPAAELERFLEIIWHDEDAYAHVCIGSRSYWSTSGKYEFGDWRERHFHSTRDRDQLVEFIARKAEDSDVYFGAAVGSDPQRRSKETAVGGRFAWTDVDRWEETTQAKWNRLRTFSPGSILVDSGRGRHGYLHLGEFVQRSELEVWNRRLRDYLGGDHKWDGSVVLRPPGTINHKNGGKVEVLEWGDQTIPPDLAGLNELLPADTYEAVVARTTVGPSETSENVPLPQITVAAEDLPYERLRKLFHRTEGDDRSLAAWNLIQACFTAGLDDDRATEILNSYPPLRERGGRGLRAWIRNELPKRTREHDHEGRTCIQAKCPNAPIWIISEVFTPEMVEIRDEICRGGQISERDATRKLGRHGRRATAHVGRAMQEAEKRGYWQKIKVGRTKPKVMLVPGRSRPKLPTVDIETGEIVSPHPGARPLGGAPAIPEGTALRPNLSQSRAPIDHSTRVPAARAPGVDLIGKAHTPMLAGVVRKELAAPSGQEKEQTGHRTDVSFCSFPTAVCSSCGEPCHADFNPHPNCPLPTQEVAAA